MIQINKIYEMDCLEGLKMIESNSIDLIVTDPPYFIENLKENLKSQSLRKSLKNNIFHAEWDSSFQDLDTFKIFIKNILDEFYRVLKPKAQVYMFMSYHHIHWIRTMIEEMNFKFYKYLIWYKPDTMGVFPNQYGCNYEMILWFRKDDKNDGKVKLNIGCGQRDVFTHNSTLKTYRKECGFHPTPKPLNLIRRLIKNGSDEGDLILDAFMGSGTTAVGCKQLNRNFIGFEINKEYIDICNKRLNQNNLLNLDKYLKGGVENENKGNNN